MYTFPHVSWFNETIAVCYYTISWVVCLSPSPLKFQHCVRKAIPCENYSELNKHINFVAGNHWTELPTKKKKKKIRSYNFLISPKHACWLKKIKNKKDVQKQRKIYCILQRKKEEDWGNKTLLQCNSIQRFGEWGGETKNIKGRRSDLYKEQRRINRKKVQTPSLKDNEINL